MKKIRNILRTFVVIAFCLSTAFAHAQNPPIQIEVNGNQVYSFDLGEVFLGTYIELEFDVVQMWPKFVTYSITHDQPNWYPHNWFNINPTNFAIEELDFRKTIQVSGELPLDLLTGLHAFTITVADNDSPPNIAWITVYYNVIGNLGYEDRIIITDCSNSFSEGDWINFEAVFEDFEPQYDSVIEWDLEIQLFHNHGMHIYYEQTKFYGTHGTYFSFYAPLLPDGLMYQRNPEGQVYGKVIITGLDNDEYEHTAYCDIGINYKPNPPVLQIIPLNEDIISVSILNHIDGNEYDLFYDLNSGIPYNGNGLPAGNSPVNMDISPTIQLDGLVSCQYYYFAAKASNQYGTSEYADEKRIKLITPPNSLPIHYHDYDLIFTSEHTFTENHYLIGNLIVESGANLTIQGGTIFFEESSKIVIEPGGKLIVDGAILTGVCSQVWHGIEVWGDEDVAQLPDAQGNYAQGFLELKNGALIENTTHGIELWRPNYWETTGGIIKAENSTFRNNSKPIHALYYHNTNPFNPNSELDYYGRFKNCVFEITSSYHGEATFYKHIDLNNVKGFKFDGCAFSVDQAAQGVSHYNAAISANNAGFSVTAYCTSQTSPCSAYNHSTFDGFNNAIRAAASSSIYTFNVERAVFTNNNCGIKTEAVNNFSVLWSEFYIGHNTTDQDDCDGIGMTASGYGINANASTGFAIEENYFTKATGAQQGYYTGIRVAETSAVDEIYNNQFNGLSYGIYAEGKNWWQSQFSHGLSLLCNQFTGSYRDIVVEQDTTTDEGGIQSSQGSALQPAGNEFVANTGDYKIYNNGNYPILYYYDVNSNSANPNPSYEVGPISTGNTNNCRSHYGGGGSGDIETIVLSDEEKLAVEQEYLTALGDYNNVKALYNNLKDGGDTQALKTEVETAWPSDMWELRAELLGKSPHLSKEVLMAAADKTDVLPESILFEILVANPDELRNEALIKYLEEKENPLPPYMINILRQVAYGATYKTALQNQMAENNRLKTRAANDMIRSILNQEETDLNALRNWLNNRGGIMADRQIIETYLAEGNVDDALALAEIIPQQYQLSNYDVDEHAYYIEMLDLRVDLLQQGRKYDELTSGEVAQLENLAQNSHGTAGAQARSILEQSYGHHFCNCLNISDNQGFKSTAVDPALLNQAYGVSLSVDPNPASVWATFNYTLPEIESKGVIKISDATGKLIKVLEVGGTQGQYVWDTREVKPGVYFYTFVVNGVGITSKLVVTK